MLKEGKDRANDTPSMKKNPIGTKFTKLTTANQIPIIRISASSHLCPRPAFFRLDDDDCPLFPPVLHIPYPRTGKTKISNRDQSLSRKGEKQDLVRAVGDPKFRRDRRRCQGMDEWDQAAGQVNW